MKGGKVKERKIKKIGKEFILYLNTLLIKYCNSVSS